MHEPPRYSLQEDAVLSPAGDRWANVSHANPLQTGFPIGGRVIAWSGWYGDDADPGAGVFRRDFRAWTPAAWNLLRERLDGWSAAAQAADALILRPHARHLLSDAQACAMLLRESTDERHYILLDPVSMLEPGMLSDLEDHVERMLQLAAWPRIVGVVVTGADVLDDQIRPSPAGASVPAVAIETYVNRFAPAVRRFYPA